jgi:ribosomal protein S15P/S13E
MSIKNLHEELHNHPKDVKTKIVLELKHNTLRKEYSYEKGKIWRREAGAARKRFRDCALLVCRGGRDFDIYGV